jgi:four helix bundle protein
MVPDNRDSAAAEHLKRRTRRFAIDVIRLGRRFPRTMDGYIVARQLIRSGTSVAANYRAACRARSAAEFVSRIAVAAEEADESQLWLDVTIDVPILDDPEVRRLFAESTELLKILTASRNTAKRNLSSGGLSPAPAIVVTGLVLALLAFLAFLAIKYLA